MSEVATTQDELTRAYDLLSAFGLVEGAIDERVEKLVEAQKKSKSLLKVKSAEVETLKAHLEQITTQGVQPADRTDAIISRGILELMLNRHVIAVGCETKMHQLGGWLEAIEAELDRAGITKPANGDVIARVKIALAERAVALQGVTPQ